MTGPPNRPNTTIIAERVAIQVRATGCRGRAVNSGGSANRPVSGGRDSCVVAMVSSAH